MLKTLNRNSENRRTSRRFSNGDETIFNLYYSAIKVNAKSCPFATMLRQLLLVCCVVTSLPCDKNPAFYNILIAA